MRSCAWIGPSIFHPRGRRADHSKPPTQCASPLSPGDTNRPGTVVPRRSGGLDVRARGFDLEQMPLVLPGVGRHPPAERVRVVDLRRHDLTRVGHVTCDVQAAEAGFFDDESRFLSDHPDRFPATVLIHQNDELAVGLGAQSTCPVIERDLPSKTTVVTDVVELRSHEQVTSGASRSAATPTGTGWPAVVRPTVRMHAVWVSVRRLRRRTAPSPRLRATAATATCRWERNPGTLTGSLQIRDEIDVAVLVGEHALAAPKVFHVAVVDLFGLDLDGLVFVGLQSVTPNAQRPDVVRPQ
jgi:hypothetical protein